MIIILKRFAMDDVPVRLVKTWKEVEVYCKRKRSIYATKKEQDIANATIGSEAAAYLAVEFDVYGKPIKSKVYVIGE